MLIIRAFDIPCQFYKKHFWRFGALIINIKSKMTFRLFSPGFPWLINNHIPLFDSSLFYMWLENVPIISQWRCKLKFSRKADIIKRGEFLSCKYLAIKKLKNREKMTPKNGIYIVQGELNHIVAALRRNTRWTSGQFNQVYIIY